MWPIKSIWLPLQRKCHSHSDTNSINLISLNRVIQEHLDNINKNILTASFRFSLIRLNQRFPSTLPLLKHFSNLTASFQAQFNSIQCINCYVILIYEYVSSIFSNYSEIKNWSLSAKPLYSSPSMTLQKLITQLYLFLTLKELLKINKGGKNWRKSIVLFPLCLKLTKTL